MSKRAQFAVAGVVTLIIGPLLVAVVMFRGVQGMTDSPKSTSNELAQLSIGATQYLVTLATGVLGLLGLFLNEKVSDLHRKLGTGRNVLILGALLSGCSLWTGFVVLQGVLRLSADGVVRAGQSYIFVLQLAQATELAIGVVLIGWIVLLKLLP